MGRHAAPRKRGPWPLVPVLLAVALVPATGTGAAPAPLQEYTTQPAITAPTTALAFERPQVTTTPAPPPPPRHPGMSLTAFLAMYEGTRTILPGYSTAECMAIFSHYHYGAVLGRPYSSPGAKDLWPQHWDEYDRIPATEPARRGDIVTWSGSYGAYQGGGFGHVAIVIEDHGSTLAAFGQNPNAATTLELSKAGVLGYLRPRILNP